MNTTIRALACVLLTAALAPAADPAAPGKPVDTTFLKQYAETRGFMLGRPQKPKFAPDGKTVLFLRADPKAPKMKLFEFDVATGMTKELLSPEALLKGAEENLSPEEKARRERQRVSVGGFTDFHFDKEGKNVLVALSGKLYVFERATAKATELKTGEGGAIVDPKWSPDGKQIAYVRGYDVYVYDLAAGKESAVTKGGTATKTHGLAEFVAQEEMGRFSGYWWSPDGKHIAYEEADHTGVETWYVADPLKPDQKPAEQFYPRPGKKNVAVKLGIIPMGGGETVWVEWERDKYEYLAAVKWDDLGPLTIQVQDRKQQKLLLLNVNTETGATKKLIEEKDGAWINLNQDVPRFDGGLGGFVWMGADAEGNAEIQTREWTKGDIQNVVVGAKNHPDAVLGTSMTRFEANIYYTGGADPTVRHVYRAKIQNLQVNPGSENDETLTTEPGMHSAVVEKRGGRYVLTSTTLKHMPKTTVFQRDRTRVGELPSVAAEPGFTPDVSVFKVGRGDDGYYCAVVRPRDFDPKKKYPVIVDVYGGPKHLHVVQAMRNWLVPQWLADQGFIVVAIDNRGTPGRGRDWERGVYQRFGTVPIEDQVKGLHALCDKFPELDRDRVGIVGWSFGGYMAANGVLRKPEVFKAAVAGAPVTDWEDYDTHYTERYMGLLPESKAAYEDASLIPLAKTLKRPLMLVHGTADDNVYYRHSLKLADALFRAGKDFDAVALPGVTHMYSADPTVMERLWAKTATFFKQHLGEPK
jgi:dipeptidyl-peptidase-4